MKPRDLTETGDLAQRYSEEVDWGKAKLLMSFYLLWLSALCVFPSIHLVCRCADACLPCHWAKSHSLNGCQSVPSSPTWVLSSWDQILTMKNVDLAWHSSKQSCCCNALPMLTLLFFHSTESAAMGVLELARNVVDSSSWQNHLHGLQA